MKASVYWQVRGQRCAISRALAARTLREYRQVAHYVYKGISLHGQRYYTVGHIGMPWDTGTLLICRT